ncbi:transglutaminase-like domain-containing protein [Actinacidiphila sp. bgisy167]|uniref:transglutaminase-like domain-containing protein n=1 Tax=Actinacidiphila sp. bgisy167 TaxID=3413797 RepID=UPI003D763F6C
MEPVPQTGDATAFLAADEVIDHEHPVVRATAARLRAAAPDPHAYAEAAYTFVRDAIPHSADSGDSRVTWRASDVLEQRTGICHAKAHALTALLRAEGIPAGLCYQRLTDEGADPLVHGLVALKPPGHDRWARQDPRGNKPGVDARFSLQEERLAWVPRPGLGERDYPGLYATPPPAILTALRQAADRRHLWRLLPTDLPDPEGR